MSQKINTYQDFIRVKQHLKLEVKEVEEELTSHKFFKITDAITNPGNIKETISESVSSLKLKDILDSPIGNLLSTYLLSNKVLRKYFIGFTILRQTVPYALNKLKDILNEIETEKKT